MNIPRPSHFYVGRAVCGCVWTSAYDMGDKDTARTVAQWITNGLTVERLPRDQAAAAFKAGLECQHPPLGQLSFSTSAKS